MPAELVYEVARYVRVGDTDELVDQIRLILDDGTPRLTYTDGSDRSCDREDLCAVVAAEPDLHGVRVDHVTRIHGRPEVIERLPLLLRAFAAPTAAAAEHASASTPDDVSIHEAENCELYVSDEWWAPFQTTDGVRFVPTGGFVGESPILLHEWVGVSFIETASRTSGYFTGELGLITAAVVADIYDPDEDDNVITLSPRGNDAQTVVNWLLHGGFSSDFYSGDNDGLAMLTQLFVDAALRPDRCDRIAGEDLAAGITKYVEGGGATPTAEWAMGAHLDRAVVDGVLELLSQTDPQLADIVTASLDPESPPGRKRATALKELDQAHRKDDKCD